MDKRKGLSFIEVMISLAIFTLFLLGGFSLYVVGINQTKKSKCLLQAVWLAKGKLDTELKTEKPIKENSGAFSSPFESFRFNIERKPILGKLDIGIIVVKVMGPENTRVTLESLFLVSR